jgi:predicted DNA-binding transcriptional regulator AlpA
MAKNKERVIEPRGLCREDAAAYMGIGATLFDRLVAAGRAPKPGRLDGRVIWDRRKLDRFLDDLFDEPELDDPHSRAV